MINVAIGIIKKGEEILLIKRERGNFKGFYGIPGGKVEEGEYIDEAVKREIREEVDLDLKFNKLLGVATENMQNNNKMVILYCCELEMDEKQEIKNPEFEYKWFSKEEFMKSDTIIESDRKMIEDFYFNNGKNYLKFDCYQDETGKYHWK